MAAEVLQSISRDEAERLRLMSEEKNQLDLQSEFVYARREGLQEGRLEGRREGKQEGRREERKELLDFIAKGYSLEDIKNEFAGR